MMTTNQARNSRRGLVVLGRSKRTSQAANEWFWANEYGPLPLRGGGAYALDCTYNDFIYHQTGRHLGPRCQARRPRSP